MDFQKGNIPWNKGKYLTPDGKDRKRLYYLRKRSAERTKEKIVQHHIKYEEIHGVDEIKIITESEHRLLHNRLRKEGKCNIPPAILNQISRAALRRSPKYKQRCLKYRRDNVLAIVFNETIAPNVQLHEWIRYNRKTGNVMIYAYFQAHNGKKLYEVNL